MLRCQPLRAAFQPSGAYHLGTSSVVSSRLGASRLPDGCNAVRCTAVPEGSSAGGSKRRLTSLEQAAEQERLKNVMLGQQAPFDGERSNGNGAPHAAAAHLALPATNQGAEEEPEPGSWDDWMRYFYAMDDVVHDLELLQLEMDDAVAREDYRTAAALKAQQQQLESADCVGAALDALELAVAQERFGDAARLRDEGGVGLLGWWVGRGDSDPTGHLLRVTPDFGRYVATAYMPRDITDLLPSLQPSPLTDPRLQQAVAARLGASAPGTTPELAVQPLQAEDVGLPVLEMFLRPCADGSGYEHQATALYAPDATLMVVDEEQSEEERAAVTSSLVEFIATDTGGDSLVNVEKGRNEDGSTFEKIEIGSLDGNGDDASPTDDELADVDDDDIRTIDDLAASVGVGAINEEIVSTSISSTDAASSSTAELDEAKQLQRWQKQAAAAEGDTDNRQGRSLRDEVAAMREALLQGGGSGFSDSEVEDVQQQAAQQWSDSEDAEMTTLSLADAASRLGCILQRAPAQIEWEGRDKFVVSVSEPPAVARARAVAEAEEAAAAAQQQAGLKLIRPPLRIIYDGKEQRQQGGLPQAPNANGSSSSSSGVRGSILQAPDGSFDSEVTAEESDSEDISVLLSQQQAQQQDVQQQQQSRRDAVAEDSAALAEQIESVRSDLEAGRKPSKDKLNDIARRAMGLAIAQGIGAADTSGNPMGNRWAMLEERTTYERLKLSSNVKTDPFSGLYVGTFGPHGPELLQVSRQVEDGREWAVATKLTGDPNVPAGTVSWKALIGHGNRLPVEMYPSEMVVTARYKGQGQVAQMGFTNAKWVEGELLVFGADSPFVRGAQLGFTFDVRANQRYLIVLHRVNLGDLFPEDM